MVYRISDVFFVCFLLFFHSSTAELNSGMICACMPVVAVLFTRSLHKLRAVVLRRRTRQTDPIGGAEKNKNVPPWPGVPRASLAGLRTFVHGGRRSSSAAGMTTLTESTYHYDGSVSAPVNDVELGHAAAKEKDKTPSSDKSSWYVMPKRRGERRVGPS
jgi:hypothetical protein